MSTRSVVHLVLHFAVPLAVAWVCYRPRWLRAWLIMAGTMLVDLDHLFAQPRYDPNRCSIGFHPLHSGVAVAIYTLLLIPQRTRLLAIGLLIHMGLDQIDCAVMSS